MYMIKLFVHKLFSLLLAMLLLVLSFNLQINYHFCEGKIKSFSLYGEAKKCEKHTQFEENKETHHQCCKHKSSSCKKTKKHKKHCCNNKTYELNFDQDYAFEYDFISFDKPSSISLPIRFNIEVNTYNSPKFNHLIGKKEPPPLLKENRQVFFQQFNC